MTTLQRAFGIKRSFHCEDLASISDRFEDEAPRSKRRRTLSLASSCDGEAPPAALISPATSQAAVAPPLPAPAAPCDDAAPRFPSLGGGATAALERFMRQEAHLDRSDDACAPSLEDWDEEGGCHAWPTFDHPAAPSSPCRVEDFPWPTAPKTTSSKFSSSLVDEAPPPSLEAACSSITPFSRFQSARSLQPLPSHAAESEAAALRHLTEALSRL